MRKCASNWRLAVGFGALMLQWRSRISSALIFAISFMPLISDAQSPTRVPRVGFLTPIAQSGREAVFREELRRLGYTDPVGADGRLGIQGPSDSDLETFPRLYATYAYVVVSRETDSTAQRPADPVLRGLLPKGR